ncbi:hypothetical protein APSETT444_004350 [Aspergillus pseudonomiae]
MTYAAGYIQALRAAGLTNESTWENIALLDEESLEDLLISLLQVQRHRPATSGNATFRRVSEIPAEDDRKALLKEIMSMTDIVITTVMNVRELEKRNVRPNTIIFDEASFFRDPEIFHALSVLSSVDRVLMVGDYNSSALQCSPTAASTFALPFARKLVT